MMIVNRKMKTLVMTSACDRHVEMGTKTWHGLLGCQGEPVTDMVRDCVFVAMTGGIGWRRPWAVVSIGMCGWVVGGGGLVFVQAMGLENQAHGRGWGGVREGRWERKD